MPSSQPGQSAGLREAASYPIAPTEFPKRRSASGTAPGPRGPPAACDILLSRGDSRSPVTPRETVTSCGRSPNVLKLVMAIGQPSADSSNARRKSPAGLRSLDITESLLSREGQLGCSLRSDVDRHPGRNRRWPQRIASIKFLAHGWRSVGYGTRAPSSPRKGRRGLARCDRAHRSRFETDYHVVGAPPIN